MFWYPWGQEAFARARAENKPILLSVGYSTCYWCHVMEREVFENPSIAVLMNQSFINIKVDREEYPAVDDIYMIARQLLTGSGGWPNNVFLTPELKPFYAGGTYAAGETDGRPSFPRLLEWLSSRWAAQETELRRSADSLTEAIRPHLFFDAPPRPVDVPTQSQQLFALLRDHYDASAGGFFQAPKFPFECYLQFLLGFHALTGNGEALEMVSHTLRKIAAGGIYDHVSGGFHRYAVDKEWYVPHFEKMLYTQAMLARVYTDAARATGNPYFAFIAKSVLDFVSGPMTDGSGAFYAAVDAETNGAEGAYYAWTVEELQSLLEPEELTFFKLFYGLADIPKFPGHKHAEGQVIIARKSLDIVAEEQKMPFVQLMGMSGHVMNKLLAARNRRQAPHLDDKIIVSWNGLMIAAFAHAGKIFNHVPYVEKAKKAAEFLLEHAIDNNGLLKRIYSGRAMLAATLEDYAYLIHGLLALYRVDPEFRWLDAASSLAQRADELFADPAGGYFFAAPSDDLLFRIKSANDSVLPNANAVMLENCIDLAELMKNAAWQTKAKALADFFLRDSRALPERSTMLKAALRLEAPSPAAIDTKAPPIMPTFKDMGAAPENMVTVTAALVPAAAKPGDKCSLEILLDIKEGWHINAVKVAEPNLVPTQIEVQGKSMQLLGIRYPTPQQKGSLLVYEGKVSVSAQLKLLTGSKKRFPVKVMARFQPCSGNACYKVRDISITL